MVKDQMVCGYTLVGDPEPRKEDGNLIYTVNVGGKKKKVLVHKGTREENIAQVIKGTLFPQWS